MVCSASSRFVCQGRKATSISTDRRGMSCTKRLIAVPPFMAKMSLFKTAGGDGQQQADRIRVGFIHEDSGSVKYRREAGSSTVCRYRYVLDSAPTSHRRRPPLFPGPK